MSDDANAEYEKLVQAIYQTLHDAEGIRTVDVKHNVKIEGKSGCKHQIDVYWEFEMMGETHRVAIECKNYRDPLEIGKVRDFFGVLYDIGHINGILVTRSGYDSGGIKFADYYNINLREARIPNEQDWKGRLKEIPLTITAFKANIISRDIIPDGEWLLMRGIIDPGDEYLSFSLPVDWEDQIIVYNGAGQRITDFLQRKRDLPTFGWEEEKGLKHTFGFDDGYVDTVELGRIKVKHIQFTYDVVSVSVSTVIEGERIARAILKDVKTGQIRFFDRDRTVR